MTLTLADLDRMCDRCPQRAATRLEFTAGELLLCGHHARQYGFTDPPTLAATISPKSEPLPSE